MMKVLKEGTLPEPPPPPWPIGVEIGCVCGCQFVPETQADFTTTAERRPGGRYTAHMICPTCRQTVEIDRMFGVFK